MKLSELIEKHGNKDVDEWAVVNVLGLKTSDKPWIGEEYWCVSDGGVVDIAEWEDNDMDNFCYSQNNCFATKEEAETYKRVLETESKLRQYAKEHNEGVIDWGNAEQEKNSVCLDTKADDPCIINWVYTRKTPRTIYFTSEEIANAAIEAVGKEAVMEYLKYEW